MRQDSWIDLRSDTVTKPTAEMRAAMAAAEVGDDVYLEDPTVNRLQERAAEIIGKEAALFVPSGTMGNQISIHIHTNPGQEVITEARGHIYNYEMAAMAVLSGTLPRAVTAPDGILNWDLIRPALSPSIYYRAQTGLITLENTHNMAGGTVYNSSQIAETCRHAHSSGIRVHLDGARIFNAALAAGEDVKKLCAPCDSVMFCLSKGLGAPVGSVVAGSKVFIEHARSVRKLLGGGMRQVGVLAAAGLIALEKMPSRLGDDHANARFLAEELSAFNLLDVNASAVSTNIVIVGIKRTGLDSARLSALLKEEGVLIGTVDAATIRMLTHFDVGRRDIEKALRVFAGLLSGKK